VRTWNLAGASEKLSWRGHDGGIADVAFSPDGNLLASASRDNKIKIWNPITGTIIKEIEFSTPLQTLCFSPDGHILAAGIVHSNLRKVRSGFTTRGRGTN
jgi:WD40 repeat protein